MTDVIADYQKWKQQGQNLRVQAKQAMESRFRELLTEAVSIAEEYRVDFGSALKPPSPITAFRYKAPARPKPKKGGKPPAVKTAPSSESKKPQANPNVARLVRRLDGAKKKLEEAKAAGKLTRPFEDRVYEIEDALRLSGQQI